MSLIPLNLEDKIHMSLDEISAVSRKQSKLERQAKLKNKPKDIKTKTLHKTNPQKLRQKSMQKTEESNRNKTINKQRQNRRGRFGKNTLQYGVTNGRPFTYRNQFQQATVAFEKRRLRKNLKHVGKQTFNVAGVNMKQQMGNSRRQKMMKMARNAGNQRRTRVVNRRRNMKAFRQQ